MPRDSNGVYSLPNGYLAVTGETIEASQHNPPLEDIRDALTASLPRNGAAPMTDDLAMGSNKITGLANGTLDTDAAAFGQIGFLHLTEVIKTDDYTLTSSEVGQAVIANKATAITFTLPAVAGAGDGPFFIRNIGAGLLTVDGNSSETIEGGANITLAQNHAAIVWPNGSTWRAFRAGVYASPEFTGTPVSTTAAKDTDTTQIATTAFVDRAAKETTIRVVSGTTDTLVLTDKGKTIETTSSSSVAVTVPPNSSVAFPTSSYINIVQMGSGAVTITAGSGVTIRSRNGLVLGGQYAMATLYKRGTDEWVAGGDLTT